MNAIHVFQTDWGTYPMPADVAAAFERAKLRKNGRPDRRTKLGRLLNTWESHELSRARDLKENYKPSPAGNFTRWAFSSRDEAYQQLGLEAFGQWLERFLRKKSRHLHS